MSGAHVGYVGNANTWECDENGHLNVRFFIAKATAALASYTVELGRAAGRPLVLTELAQHMRFLREVRPAAPLTARVTTLGDLAGHDADLRVLVELVGTADGQPHATLVTDLGCRDLHGHVEPLPEAAATAARDFLGELPDHAAPRSVDPDRRPLRPDLARAEAMGLAEIARTRVAPQQLDRLGHMEACHFAGLVSDGIVNLLTHFQTPDELDQRSNGRLGGAVLEYRLLYLRPVHVGNVLSVRSGLAEIAEKTHRIVHWMFDVETGEIVASAEAVAVTLDLESRRAVAIPDDRRARMQSLLVEGLAI